MNKVTVTIESSDSSFVNRIMAAVHGRPEVNVVLSPPIPVKLNPESQATAQAPAPQGAVAAQPPVDLGAVQQPPSGEQKRVRKPRADAGKPRGPYKDGGAQDAAPAGTTAGASAAPAAAGVNAQPAPVAKEAGSSPAAAATNDAYQAEIEARNAAARASVGATPPAAPAKITHDDIRNHLALINKVPGLGMAGCHAFLASFTPTGAAAPGVKRISDVQEGDFVRFMAEVDARIAKFQAEGK